MTINIRVKKYSSLMALCLMSIIVLSSAAAQNNNQLSKTEKQNGWQLLFDGNTFAGWQKIANSGWRIEDGQIVAEGSSDGKQRDIITTGQFDNFELSIDFKLFNLTNSGIKYLVINTFPGQVGNYLGLEYQLLDDKNFVYPDRGVYRSLASLYDLIPANENKGEVTLGKWNTARILVKGNHIEHWLNGKMVVQYDRSSEHFDTLVADSKYKNLENFGKEQQGHILLQNEGSPVAFRNIKIRPL